MSSRSILMVVLALVFGTSAAIGVGQLSRAPARVETNPETVSVVVAAKDVPRYTTLTADVLKLQPFPKNLVPPGSITRVEDAVDRVTDSHLVKGEAVLEGKLTAKGAGRGIGAVIPKGMRAVTIQTPNVATGVAGFVLPGSKVDVLFTMRSGHQDDPNGGGLTRTLVQNVEILAVDQRIEAPADNKVDTRELRSVTLLVTPDQAAEIDLAQHAGTLHLTLRNHQDTEATTAGSATLHGIQGRQTAVDPRVKDFLDKGTKLLADLEAAAKAAREKPAPVAVAPAPTPKPEVPEAPPRIRTLRSGIPGQVYIE